MTSLATAVDDYLCLRRAPGFKLRDTAVALHDFVSFLERQGAARITTELALEWATRPQHAQPSHRARRLGMGRLFAEYRSAGDAATEVPPSGLLPGRYTRKDPYLYSDAEVHLLLAAAPAPLHHGLAPLDVSDAVRTAGRHGTACQRGRGPRR